MISFTVVESQTDIADISSDNTVAYRQAASDSDGNYNVSFKVKGESRYFDIYIGCEGREEYDKISDVLYILESENTAARESLSGAADDKAVYEVLKEHLNSLDCNKNIFDRALIKAVAGATVKYADGYEYVRDYLIGFADELGVNESHVTNDVARKMLGNSYSDLPKSIDEIYKSLNKAPSGGGGGGTGVKISPKVNDISAPAVVNPDINTQKTETAFDNIPDNYWAKDAIYYLKNKGIVSGKTPNRFVPEDNVCREEFTKMVMTSVPFSNLEGETPFEDNLKGEWYYPYIKNAYLANIVSGVSQNYFGVGEKITRQDIAVIIYRALKEYGITLDDSSPVTFADANNISGYAEKAVAALSGVGIINGDENHCFRPKDYASRAESAKIIYEIEDLTSDYDIRYYNSNNKMAKKKIDRSSVIVYNGKEVGKNTFELFKNLNNGIVRLIDFDNDGQYNHVFIKDYADVLIGGYDSENNVIYDKFTGKALRFDDIDGAQLYNKSFSAVSAASLTENTVLSVAYTEGVYFEALVSSEKITGVIDAVTESNGRTQILVNGIYYDVSDNYMKKYGITGLLGINAEISLNVFGDVAYISMPGTSDSKFAVLLRMKVSDKPLRYEHCGKCKHEDCISSAEGYYKEPYR